MPVSPYFDHTPRNPNADQYLLEDMINEQIYIMGSDVFYILRESADEIDWILGEDPTSIFERAYKVAAYINEVENWENGSDLWSKFGLQITKQNSIVVTRRHFNRSVGNNFRDAPSAGDLVFIPVFQKLFEIKKVSKEANFFTLGSREAMYYTLDLEMFKYSHEPINTGYEELDILETENAYVIELHLSGGNTAFWRNETVYQGANNLTATATALVKYWDSANSILGIYDVTGEFSNTVIYGDSSGATWNIAGYDDKENNEEFRSYQNSDLEVAANSTIVKTETNPFGSM